MDLQPSLTKTLGMFSVLVAWSSDRRQEKFWHIVGT
jgi:hypothetical protein